MAAKLKQLMSGRIKRLRAMMFEQGLDGLIVTNLTDVRYLTGYTGSAGILLLTEDRKLLVSDSRYTIQLKQQCPGLPVFMRKNETVDEAIAVALQRCLSKWKKRQPPCVGIEQDMVSYARFKRLRKLIGKGLIPCDLIVPILRQIKDTHEVTQIRKAGVIAQEALLASLEQLAPGMTEMQLCAILEYEIADRGGRPASFDPIIAFGANAAKPHAYPGNARFRKGQPILIDWGATSNGYKSDLTRCFCNGRIPPAFADAYEWVLEAQVTAIELIKPGAVMSEVDRAARKVMKRSGLPVFGHGLGHGLGLDIHEEPRFNPVTDVECEPGMVMTVEPGIYLAGKMGIRIEDDVLVTERGKRLLTDLPKDLASVRL